MCQHRLSYTLREAAGATGLSPRSIRRLIDNGTLPSFKPSGMNVRLIKGADLAAWIDRQRTTGEPWTVNPAPQMVYREAG